jgi:hypothetical protein
VPEGPQAVRSVVAVGGGFFATQILTLGADLALEDHATVAVKVAYTAVIECLAGYITARLAVRRPLLHAFILSLILLALSVVIALITWDTASSRFHTLTLLLIVPVTVLGGKLREFQVSRSG